MTLATDPPGQHEEVAAFITTKVRVQIDVRALLGLCFSEGFFALPIRR